MKNVTRTGKGTSQMPWHLVDWKQQDIIISEKLGCSRERVRQKRKELGVAQSKDWHLRRGSVIEKVEALGSKTSTMTLKEVSETVGCSSSYALQMIKRAGLTYKSKPAGKNSKYDWSKADWSKSHKEIAKDLGVKNIMVVSQYRRRLTLKQKQKALDLGTVSISGFGGCSQKKSQKVEKGEKVSESVV